MLARQRNRVVGGLVGVALLAGACVEDDPTGPGMAPAPTPPALAVGGPAWTSTWAASSGLVPTAFSDGCQAGSGWQRRGFVGQTEPALAGGRLTITVPETTGGGAPWTSYFHQIPAIAMPAAPTVEARVRVASGTHVQFWGAPAVLAVRTAGNVRNALMIGADEIFLLANDGAKGPSAVVDTDGGFHTYRMEFSGTASGSTVRVYYDGVLTLTGASYTTASADEKAGAPGVAGATIGWGSGTYLPFGSGLGNVFGVTEWEYVRHNATRIPAGSGCFDLIATADDKSITTGDPDPAFTFQHDGFEPGHVFVDFDQPTCRVYGPHAAPGEYPIVCSGGVLAAGPGETAAIGYQIAYLDGTLTVQLGDEEPPPDPDPSTLTVTPDEQTITYGNDEPAFSFDYDGFAPGDGAGVLTTQPTCGVNGAHANVGSYTITCSGGVDDEYAFVYRTASLTVERAALTVRAADQQITAGDPDPAFTFQYSGLTGGDGPEDIDTPPTCGVSAAHAVPGTYPITCAGGADGNYTLAYVNGTLRVNERPSTGAGALLLLLDEEAISHGTLPNRFSRSDVNDGHAKTGQRKQLPWFAGHVGRTIHLYSGYIADEGWFALKTIPSSWNTAGPTSDGARNLLLAGPGLGIGSTRLLEKVPDVTPLRATGLALLKNQRVCAVVWDRDIGIKYRPLSGNLKGANLGIVAFEVLEVTRFVWGWPSALPRMKIRVLDAATVCAEPLSLLSAAPAPKSLLLPFDVVP